MYMGAVLHRRDELGMTSANSVNCPEFQTAYHDAAPTSPAHWNEKRRTSFESCGFLPNRGSYLKIFSMIADEFQDASAALKAMK